MSKLIEQEGTFRGCINGYYIRESSTSDAVAVAIRVTIDEIWHQEAWCDYSEYKMEATGDLWIIKRDGKPNDRQVRSLMDYAGWDGDFQSIYEDKWSASPIQIVVKENADRDGNAEFRIAWINGFDDVPGGSGGRINQDGVKQLQQRYGAQMRALASTSQHASLPLPSAAPTKSTPPTPTLRKRPPAVEPTPPASDRPDHYDPPEDDEIPF